MFWKTVYFVDKYKQTKPDDILSLRDNTVPKY